MRIFGLGLPELVLFGFIVLVVTIVVVTIAVLASRSSKKNPLPLQPSSYPPPSIPTNDDATLLATLADLHKQGILNDEEYAQKKAEILSRM